MTTIHFSTTGELLRILDDHPEVLAELRRKLLTDDLLAMPESARAIRETQREMQETQQRIADLLNQTAERLDALEARQAQHDASLARIEASQERMEARQDRMETKQDRMEATQAEMLQWQAKADTRFDRIESQQAETLQWQAKADTRFDRIEGRLGNLTGKDLEREAITKFARIAHLEFGVVKTQMLHVTTLHSYTIPDRLAEPYRARIDVAESNGLITYAEEVELGEADIVARGYSRQDATHVWFVAEISGTIAFDDIRRAHERADILSRALAETVIPVVYGIRVSDRLRVVAESRGVRIAMRPQPDEDVTYLAEPRPQPPTQPHPDF